MADDRDEHPATSTLWRDAASALKRLAGIWQAPQPPAPTSRPRRRDDRSGVALALQGGGAHGAFTWGVLDAMLENGIAIEALSGSSAGAFNAVFLAHGWIAGGAEGARESLAHLWRRIGAKAAFSPLRASLMDQLTGGWNMDHSSSHVGFDLFTRVMSPYQFNPLDMNPLRELLLEHIDFERIRRNRRLRLFIGATDVESGHLRLFTTRELTAEVILASATLPWLHHAVEIDGHHYWDGGFTANPPLMPLVSDCAASDLVLVRLDSGREETVPVSARAIQARLNRILFTNPLNHDLDELVALRKLADRGALRGPLGRRLMQLRLHVIDGGEALAPFGQSSKLNPHRTFLRELHALGYAHGESWAKHEGGGAREIVDPNVVVEVACP